MGRELALECGKCKFWLSNELLSLLEHWFSISVTCVRWGSCYSHFFSLLAGVRQGGVLSPLLFAIFIDSLVDK